MSKGFNPIPARIESLFDQLSDAVLVCSKCKKLITIQADSGLKMPPRTSIQFWVQMHVCAKIDFKYDFNSPLTLIEQRDKALREHE